MDETKKSQCSDYCDDSYVDNIVNRQSDIKKWEEKIKILNEDVKNFLYKKHIFEPIYKAIDSFIVIRTGKKYKFNCIIDTFKNIYIDCSSISTEIVIDRWISYNNKILTNFTRNINQKIFVLFENKKYLNYFAAVSLANYISPYMSLKLNYKISKLMTTASTSLAK